MNGARVEAIVRPTSWGKSLRTAASCPGTTHGISKSLDVGARGCPVSEKADPSSAESAREGHREEHDFREPGPAGPIWSH